MLPKKQRSALPPRPARSDSLPAPKSDVFPGFTQLFLTETFDEPLKYCTDQYWLKRYEIACATSRALSDHRKVVLDAAEPWQAWLYDKLIIQVSGYVDLGQDHGGSHSCSQVVSGPVRCRP